MRTMRFLFLGMTAVTFLLSGCGSSAIKEKRKERERLAKTSPMYCEFVNAEINPDIELEMNLQMAKKCDSDKPFSMTQFKTPSENQGIMFCCSSLSSRSEKPAEAAPAAAAKPKDTKADEKELKLED